MFSSSPPEVFSREELARAAGVPVACVQTLIAQGRLRRVAGTDLIRWDDAVSAAHDLRAAAAAAPAPKTEFLGPVNREPAPQLAGSRRIPALASSMAHAAVVGLLLLGTSMDAGPVVADTHSQPARMVFIVSPGPGGGGGGGGERTPKPAATLERQGPARQRTSVPDVTPEPAVLTARNIEPPRRPTPAAVPLEPRPAATEPEPLPASVLVAPVVKTAANERDRAGVVADAVADNPNTGDSRGPGQGSGAGAGRGSGSGNGDGSGLGEGLGGGTGGGPYRPGSGISPPRLFREVKAGYTDDARRRNLTGDVLLEIVVRRDGSVGEVRVIKGLGAGLEQRAVEAVRQWQFDPARRKGVPVDVLVEVAVEFSLR